jgi:hypothetical protein
MTPLHGNRRWSDQTAEHLLTESAQRAISLNDTRRDHILAVLLAEAARLRSAGGWHAWLQRIAARAGVYRK